MSLFSDTNTEEIRIPLPAELGKGLLKATKISENVGVIDTNLAKCLEPFDANLHTPKSIKFSFLLSNCKTSISIGDDKNELYLPPNGSVLMSVPETIKNVIPLNHELHNVCINIDPN